VDGHFGSDDEHHSLRGVLLQLQQKEVVFDMTPDAILQACRRVECHFRLTIPAATSLRYYTPAASLAPTSAVLQEGHWVSIKSSASRQMSAHRCP
jgi:hypothetical protein